MFMGSHGSAWLCRGLIPMCLGIARRDRHAIRADKFWKSVWLRQMLQFDRGLTKRLDRGKNRIIKSIHGSSMINLKENNE
jgi:hypothetical protein